MLLHIAVVNFAVFWHT